LSTANASRPIATQNTKSASATHVRAWQKFFFFFYFALYLVPSKNQFFYFFIFDFNLHIYTEEGRCLLEMKRRCFNFLERVIRAGIEVYIWPAASHCPNVSISLLLFGILKLDFFFFGK
jgi:hypothetical protein